MSYHHRGPCNRGSPVTLGGTERSEALTSKLIIERRVIANEINKYFVSLASKLNDEVKIQSGNFSNFLPRSQSKSMFLNGCCEDEVSTIIEDLQNGKSSDIPIGVIKNY